MLYIIICINEDILLLKYYNLQATIIGYKTRKFLFVGIRNRFHIICSRAETKNETPSNLICFLNWKKTANGMEADGITEGFLKSIELHKLKFNKLIGRSFNFIIMHLYIYIYF